LLRAEYPKEWTVPLVMASVVHSVEVIYGYHNYHILNQLSKQLVFGGMVGCGAYLLGFTFVFPMTASNALEVYFNEISFLMF
jgi:hypothetical protein